MNAESWQFASSLIVKSEGRSVLSVLGDIGQSCDRQQTLLKLEHPDGRVEITDSHMRWIMELRP